MSCFYIYYKDKAKMMRPVLTAAEYRNLRDSERQKEVIRQVRRSPSPNLSPIGRGVDTAKLKMQLVQMNYSCIPAEDKKLKGCKFPSNSVGMDVDLHRSDFSNDNDYEKALANIPGKVLAKKDELGLLMLERSATKGFHLVFKRKPELNQEENLRWASDLLGVEFDKGAKDITRVFFTTTASEEDLLFLDDGLFEQKACLEDTTAKRSVTGGNALGSVTSNTSTCLEGTTSEGGEQGTALQAEVSSRGVNPAVSSPSSSMQPVTEIVASSHDVEDSSINHKPVTEIAASSHDAEDSSINHKPSTINLDYLGIPYSDIIAKYWEMFNDGQVPTEGNRNVLTYELAMTLRAICDYDVEKMMQVIPNYWNSSPNGGGQEGASEWRKTIMNALNEPRKSMPYRLRQVLKAVKDDRKLNVIGDDNEPSTGTGTDIINGKNGLPQRPRRMPGFMSLVSSKVPMKLKAMVEESIWPALCAHLHGVKFQYIDGVLHEANICSALIARQSSGKGRVNEPIECLLKDISMRDEENKAREKEWRRRNQGKGQSKDRQPRPEDIVIQRLDDDLTSAALAQSLIDAENNGGRRIITKVDEIELLNKVGNGKNDTVALLVRYGFDAQKFGQRRVGLESVNGSYTVRWVWNASCTPKSAMRFINRNWITDGTLSRLNINALLIPKEDHEMPKIGRYDDAYQDALKPYIDRLNAASGLVDCPQANKLAEELKAEHDRVADLCESEGYRTFCYRAIVIGWLKAIILYIMNGYKWDKLIADYVRYSVRRDMWLKMYYFGELIEEEFEDEEKRRNRGPKNLLDSLPDEFSYEKYLEVRQQLGKSGDGKSTLRVWKKRGYVVLDEVTNCWVKRYNVTALQ